MSSRDLLRRGVLLHVVAQSLLQRRYSGSGAQRARRAGRRRLRQGADREERRQADAARPRPDAAPDARPNGPTTTGPTPTTPPSTRRRRAFVRRAAETRRWRLAWDLGCNTGTFSQHRRAARRPGRRDGRRLDGDRAALPARARRGRRGRILPLVVNLADASPSQGWRGVERKDLASRGAPRPRRSASRSSTTSSSPPTSRSRTSSTGSPASAPPSSSSSSAATTRWSQALLANREDQYDDYTLESFRSLLAEPLRHPRRGAAEGRQAHDLLRNPPGKSLTLSRGCALGVDGPLSRQITAAARDCHGARYTTLQEEARRLSRSARAPSPGSGRPPPGGRLRGRPRSRRRPLRGRMPGSGLRRRRSARQRRRRGHRVNARGNRVARVRLSAAPPQFFA